MSDEAAEGEAKPESPSPSPPKAKTSLLVLLLLVVNIGGTGFVAFKSLKMESAAAHAAAPSPTAEEIEAAKAKKEEEEKTAVGPVTPLEPFIVNLNEPDATRYLKANFELEVSAPEVVEQLEKLKRPIRDDVLRYLSSLSVADTQGETGKAKIQQEIVARIDKQLGGGRVKRMFIVEFMVQ